MIIGFSRHFGIGGSRPVLDYLTGYLVNGKERATKPVILRGEPEAVAEILDALPFQRKYSSGVLSFAPEDRVTPAIQEDIMDRFEAAVFAGLPPDRRSIVWIKHTDKGRVEMHFIAARVDLGTGKSLNIAPPTPASRHLLDTLREAINSRYGFSDPADPERARNVSLPSHVAKLAAQARRQGRSPKPDIRQTIADNVQARAEAGTIRSRADIIAFLNQQGFTIARAGLNYLTIVRPDTGKRVRLKGNLFRENFCTRDLQPTPRRHDPAQLLALERRLERLVEKRAQYHRARYGVVDQADGPAVTRAQTIYDRTGNTSPQRLQTIGTTIPPARSVACQHAGRFVEAAQRWCSAERELELATVGVADTTRTFAERIEPSLNTPAARQRIVVSLFRYPAGVATAAGTPALHDRDNDMEPDMEVDLP
jgi:hypothetical protein